VTDLASPPATRLQLLLDQQGQSPWLDDLTRGYLTGGELSRWVTSGIRGVTSNPTIFQRAIAGSGDYDQQFTELTRAGHSVDEAYWHMVTDDVTAALAVLRPVYDTSGGSDGFVSVEVAPDLAHDTAGTVAAARGLHDRIGQPNLLVKVPATTEGIAAIRQLVAGGHSINATLVFGLPRYAEVIEAYLAGLEELAARDPHVDLSTVASVASFFVSRVDTAVDQQLTQLGTVEAATLQGQAAIAQAQLAYQLFTERFTGLRWDALAARGARLQRPLWASTSTKNPALPDTRYVDELIGPNTITTMPPATIAAVSDHGTIRRTVDRDVAGARDALDRLTRLGIDLDEISATLETEGVSSFIEAFSALNGVLAAKAANLIGPEAESA
jgi:transaldolase